MHSSYPTRSQKRTLWIALTALATVTIGAIAVGAIWLGTWILGYLQPLLIPFAVAGVLSYLLYPLVRKLKDRGMEPKKAGTLVFAAFMFLSAGLMTFVVSTGVRQAGALADEFPTIKDKFEQTVDKRAAFFDKWIARFDSFAKGAPQKEAETAEPVLPPAAPETAAPETEPDTVSLLDTDPFVLLPPTAEEKQKIFSSDTTAPSHSESPFATFRKWLTAQYPELARQAWKFVRGSVGGFLGTFGFILGFLVVPIYLFFFLREGPRIQDSWSNYLPIRASRFKNELVATLKEINDYLIAFFRGQMLVSLIDGLITAVLLTALGLKFGLLIGLLVGILGIIPFIGILICYLPAIMIATVQAQSGDWQILGFIEGSNEWWVLPLVVTIVFVAVNNLDGILIAPKIVGDSVGLHPFTIIFSVLFWSTLLGGLLGSILAVPLTAAVKV
ncbi:AI-2E family transporter, partial [Verrucomicrobiales bacterium]|nr:AI-2E family transporter [Verrucomicrobiales bacterium]